MKPLSHDGIILYSGSENSEKEVTDYICLLINQGYVEFYTDLGNGVGVIKSDVKLGLDNWHRVSITISSRLINLDINGVSTSNHIPGNSILYQNALYLFQNSLGPLVLLLNHFLQIGFHIFLFITLGNYQELSTR